MLLKFLSIQQKMASFLKKRDQEAVEKVFKHAIVYSHFLQQIRNRRKPVHDLQNEKGSHK